MRTLFSVLAILGLFLGLAPAVSAQDEALAIVAKAIKAHGGDEKLKKLNALQTQAKGTLEVAGMSLTFTQEASIQFPDKIKDVLQLEVNGQKIPITTVYDGKQGWINHNGTTIDMSDDIKKELKESIFLMKMGGLTALKDKDKFKLTPLGEAKVNNKPAVGIKIESKGARDINLYFDKETGLFVKIERRTLDFASGQEVAEERIVTEYQEVDGLKTAKKVVIHRDGKKFLEAEVLEAKFVDKLDDSVFTKP